MPPKKRHPGNKGSKGRAVTSNTRAMTHEELNAYKMRKQKVNR